MAAAQDALAVAQGICADVAEELGPPDEGIRCVTQQVVPLAVVRRTRGYIELVANQANGAYANGWYDACAVMVRRLLETLIVEAFEHHRIDSKIKGTGGDFLYLGDLVDKCLQETTWNLSRNCKRALPRLKEIGDLSAQ